MIYATNSRLYWPLHAQSSRPGSREKCASFKSSRIVAPDGGKRRAAHSFGLCGDLRDFPKDRCGSRGHGRELLIEAEPAPDHDARSRLQRPWRRPDRWCGGRRAGRGHMTDAPKVDPVFAQGELVAETYEIRSLLGSEAWARSTKLAIDP